MTTPMREIVALADLPVDVVGDFFAVLTLKEAGTTREAKPFFNLRFEAKGRSLAFAVWNDMGWFGLCRDSWRVGQWFKIRGLWRDHARYGPKLEASLIRLANDDDRDDGFDPAALSGLPQIDPDQLFVSIIDLAESIVHPGLKSLTLALLCDHEALLKKLPASKGRFHVHPGGWVQHTLGVAHTVSVLVLDYIERNPSAAMRLDRDLAVSAALLHEIGRVREWVEPEEMALVPPEISVEGQLVGPHLLARDMVRDKAVSIPELDATRRLALEHLLLSFLERPEWGSPRLPAMPEALILHHADDMDAKLEMYLRHMDESTGTGPFTQADPVLKRVLWSNRNFPPVPEPKAT